MNIPKLGNVYASYPVLRVGWNADASVFYPTNLLQTLKAQFSPGVGDLTFFGDDIPHSASVEAISHRTNKLYTRNNDPHTLFAQIQIIETAAGKRLETLLRSKKAHLECLMRVRVNRFDEAIADSVQYMRIVAVEIY